MLVPRDDDLTALDSILVDASPRQKERELLAAVKGAATALKAATPQGQAINVAAIMAANTSISQQFQAPPEQVTQAMADQGLTSSTPFGPGTPLNPWTPVGDPGRQYNYQVGTNITVTPRTGRTSFATMDAVTDGDWVAQVCQRHLANDVRSLDLLVQPADGVTVDVDNEVAQARAFLRKPDGRTPQRAWLMKLMYDMMRYDAPCIYKQRNRAGAVTALKVRSGKTIIPLTDEEGELPTGDAPAYLQIIQGLVWSWFTDDDLIYQPLNPRPDSPYGTSPIEMVLLTANTNIRFQLYLLQRFTQGNIPAAFMEAPPDYASPAALTELQEVWDAFNEGQQLRKSQVRFVPSGSKVTPFREDGFDEDMAMYFLRAVCAAHGVTPNDLGITLDVNRATGDTQVDVQFRVGTKPITTHIEDMLDSVLQDDMGLRVQARFDDGQEKEDRLAEAQTWAAYVDMGAASPDEPRVQVLGLPVEAGEMTPRFIQSKAGPVPLKSISEIAGDIDPLTGAPVAGSIVKANLRPGQFAGPVGVKPQPDDLNAVEAGNLAQQTAAVAAPMAVVAAPTGAVASDGPPEGEASKALLPEVSRLLAMWRRNSRTRVEKGLPPRMFEGLPTMVAAEVWADLEHATTRSEVDEVFKAVVVPKVGAGGP